MKKVLVYFFAFTGISNLCLADSSITNAPLVNRFDLKYLGIFDGPSVIYPSKYMPDSEGRPDLSRPIQLTNYLMAGYKISTDFTVGSLLTFGYYPFLENSEFMIFDPAVRFTHRGLFKSENFKMIADLRIFVPTTSTSKKLEMVTALQSFQMTEYSFPHSRWTIGSLSSLKLGIYTTKDLKVQNWSIYLAPNVNYYFNDNVSLSLFSGATVSQYSQKGSSHLEIEDPYLGPGANISVGDIFTFSPALVVPPNAPKLSNLSLLVFIVGRFF